MPFEMTSPMQQGGMQRKPRPQQGMGMQQGRMQGGMQGGIQQRPMQLPAPQGIGGLVQAQGSFGQRPPMQRPQLPPMQGNRMPMQAPPLMQGGGEGMPYGGGQMPMPFPPQEMPPQELPQDDFFQGRSPMQGGMPNGWQNMRGIRGY